MKYITTILGVLTLLILAGCTPTEDVQQEVPEIPEIEEATPEVSNVPELPETVATINGEEITGAEVSDMITQMQMQGLQVTPEDVVDQIIMQILLTEEAQNRNYDVSSENVEELFEQQGISSEELRPLVEAEGMNYDEFIENQKIEVKLSLLIEEEANVEITEEEARQFFDEQAAMFEEDVSYEEVGEEIKQFLADQASNDALLALGRQLMEEADIERFY